MEQVIPALLFLLSFFLVGAVACRLLGLAKARPALESAALSFGLGLFFVPVLFFLLAYLSGGAPTWIPYGITGLSLVGYLGLCVRSRPSLPSIGRTELVLLGIVALHVAIIYTYLSTFAIFPDSGFAHDYANNLQMLSSTKVLLYSWGSTQLFKTTQLTSLLLMLYGIVFLQGNPLFALRYSMVIVAAVVPIVVYHLSLRLFKDKEASLFATAAYALAFPFWLIGVLSTGLYAQFYAGALFLVFLWIMTEYVEEKVSIWVPAVLAFLLLLAHPTSFLFLGIAAVSCVVVYAATGRNDSKYRTAAMVCGIPLLAAVVVVLSFGPMSYLQALAAPGGTFSYTLDALSPILSHAPFLFVIDSFVGPLCLGLLLCTAVIGTVAAFRRSLDRRYVVVLGWFWTTWLATLPFGELHTVSRYVIFAFPAFSLLLGLFFLLVVKPLRTRVGWNGGTRTRLGKSSYYVLVVALFLVLAVQGATGQALATSVPVHSFATTKQDDILQSMLWAKNSTAANAVMVSVGLPEYSFLPFIANRTYAGDVAGPPSVVTSYLKMNGFTSSTGESGTPIYVVLFSLLHNSTMSSYKLYASVSNYTLAFNSTDIAVFRIG